VAITTLNEIYNELSGADDKMLTTNKYEIKKYVGINARFLGIP
jgi:hypothetical protein